MGFNSGPIRQRATKLANSKIGAGDFNSSIPLVPDVSAAEQAYSTCQCLDSNCRLLRTVACNELSPVTNYRLLRIVACYGLSPAKPAKTCRMLRIVALLRINACYELSTVTNCRLLRIVACYGYELSPVYGLFAC